MRLFLINHQRRDPVPLVWLKKLAGCAVRRLEVAQEGRLFISFISNQKMRALNLRFAGQNAPTDVLSFRYPNDSVAGEILIAPACARLYAKRHGIAYRQELARYVIHGLLHWLGHDDRTPRQQQRMRTLEDQLLAQCAR